jgi:hypothetical protein
MVAKLTFLIEAIVCDGKRNADRAAVEAKAR